MLAAHVLLAIRELQLAADLGAGHRPACARSTVGRSAALQFGCVTVCQGCVSATPCPRCAALVQPSAKIQLRDLRADRLAPKADTLVRRFPVCWVQPRRFLRVEHGPLQACRRLTGGTRQTSLETGLSDSSPHEAVSSSPRPPHKTKARRALHRMALAGTVPLLARIPSPATEPRTGRNVPADAGSVRRVTRSLSSGAQTHDLPTMTSQDCIAHACALPTRRTAN